MIVTGEWWQHLVVTESNKLFKKNLKKKVLIFIWVLCFYFQKYLEHTPDSLLQAAKSEYMKNPRDVSQTSEKLWLGAVFAVKEKLAEVGYLLVTHNSFNRCVEFMGLCTKDAVKSLLLQSVWTVAEFLSKSDYQYPPYTESDFLKYLSQINAFIDLTRNINTNDVKEKIDEYCQKDFFVENLENIKKVRFCGKEFQITHRCY